MAHLFTHSVSVSPAALSSTGQGRAHVCLATHHFLPLHPPPGWPPLPRYLQFGPSQKLVGHPVFILSPIYLWRSLTAPMQLVIPQSFPMLPPQDLSKVLVLSSVRRVSSIASVRTLPYRVPATQVNLPFTAPF